MAYTDISRVQEFMQTEFDSESTPSISYVTTLIEEADEEIDELTGTSFELKEHEQIFNLENYVYELYPDKLPLNEVVDIYINTGTPTNPIWDTEINDFYVDKNIIKFLKRGYQGPQKLKVVYKYGFDGPTKAVKDLATRLVAKHILTGEDSTNGKYTRTRVGPLDVSRNIGSGRFLNLDNEITNLKSKLGNYKNTVI